MGSCRSWSVCVACLVLAILAGQRQTRASRLEQTSYETPPRDRLILVLDLSLSLEGSRYRSPAIDLATTLLADQRDLDKELVGIHLIVFADCAKTIVAKGSDEKDQPLLEKTRLTRLEVLDHLRDLVHAHEQLRREHYARRQRSPQLTRGSQQQFRDCAERGDDLGIDGFDLNRSNFRDLDSELNMLLTQMHTGASINARLLPRAWIWLLTDGEHDEDGDPTTHTPSPPLGFFGEAAKRRIEVALIYLGKQLLVGDRERQWRSKERFAGQLTFEPDPRAYHVAIDLGDRMLRNRYHVEGIPDAFGCSWKMLNGLVSVSLDITNEVALLSEQADAGRNAASAAIATYSITPELRLPHVAVTDLDSRNVRLERRGTTETLVWNDLNIGSPSGQMYVLRVHARWLETPPGEFHVSRSAFFEVPCPGPDEPFVIIERFSTVTWRPINREATVSFDVRLNGLRGEASWNARWLHDGSPPSPSASLEKVPPPPFRGTADSIPFKVMLPRWVGFAPPFVGILELSFCRGRSACTPGGKEAIKVYLDRDDWLGEPITRLPIVRLSVWSVSLLAVTWLIGWCLFRHSWRRFLDSMKPVSSPAAPSNIDSSRGRPERAGIFVTLYLAALFAAFATALGSIGKGIAVLGWQFWTGALILLLPAFAFYVRNLMWLVGRSVGDKGARLWATSGLTAFPLWSTVVFVVLLGGWSAWLASAAAFLEILALGLLVGGRNSGTGKLILRFLENVHLQVDESA